jgi:hypothetical protein
VSIRLDLQLHSVTWARFAKWAEHLGVPSDMDLSFHTCIVFDNITIAVDLKQVRFK